MHITRKRKKTYIQSQLKNFIKDWFSEDQILNQKNTDILYCEDKIYQGGKYTGYCLNHLSLDEPHGFGKWIHPNGDSYEGQFKYGKKNGLGLCIYSDGSRYLGQFEAGYLHGWGGYFAKEFAFMGKFQMSYKKGMGIKLKTNKELYIGQFEGEYADGFGIELLNTGERNIGGWKNGKKEGVHFEINLNGDLNGGEWENNVRKKNWEIWIYSKNNQKLHSKNKPSRFLQWKEKDLIKNHQFSSEITYKLMENVMDIEMFYRKLNINCVSSLRKVDSSSQAMTIDEDDVPFALSGYINSWRLFSEDENIIINSLEEISRINYSIINIVKSEMGKFSS